MVSVNVPVGLRHVAEADVVHALEDLGLIGRQDDRPVAVDAPSHALTRNARTLLPVAHHGQDCENASSS